MRRARSLSQCSIAEAVAVLTPIDERDAKSLLSMYGLADLCALEGVAGGSVNSNFAIELAGRRLFLRVYEEQDREGAVRETAMLDRLSLAGVPTPAPLRRLDGGCVSDVRGKPAALFPWRNGRMRCQAGVGARDAARIGEALAKVHVAGAGEKANTGRFRYEDLVLRLDRIAASGDERFVSMVPRFRALLERVQGNRDSEIPRGLTHGDLFRDNVLWDDDGDIAALLDFESACEESYAFDLMVAVLSWCVGDDLDPRLARALCDGYERVRLLSDREKRALRGEGMFAALRFAITRITDYAMRKGGEGPRVVKDWRRFIKRFDRLDELGRDGVSALLGR
jgi:homoserine kinase type II